MIRKAVASEPGVEDLQVVLNGFMLVAKAPGKN